MVKPLGRTWAIAGGAAAIGGLGVALHDIRSANRAGEPLRHGRIAARAVAAAVTSAAIAGGVEMGLRTEKGQSAVKWVRELGSNQGEAGKAAAEDAVADVVPSRAADAAVRAAKESKTQLGRSLAESFSKHPSLEAKWLGDAPASEAALGTWTSRGVRLKNDPKASKQVRDVGEWIFARAKALSEAVRAGGESPLLDELGAQVAAIKKVSA